MKIFALESLRGLGAFIVFLGHFVQVFGGSQWFERNHIKFLLNGTASVYLFFVLSGFVLSYKFWMSYSRRELFFSAFYRFFRLFFMVVTCGFLGWLFHSIGFLNTDKQVSFLIFLKQSFLVFLDGQHFDVVFWTMKYELFGSLLLFGAIYFAYSPPPSTKSLKNDDIQNFNSATKKFKVVTIVFIFSICFLDIFHILPWRVGIKYFALFFVGAIAAILFKNAKYEFRSIYWLLPYGCCCYILFDRQFVLLQYDNSGVVDFLGYCFACFVVLYGSLSIRIIRRLLENKYLVFFGKISFALYASHMIVFWSFGMWFFEKLNFISFSFRFGITFIVCLLVTGALAIYLTELDKKWIKKIKDFRVLFFPN